MAEELYMVGAQYETTEAIQAMSQLVQQSLEIQGKQVQMLEALRESGEQQTRLTRLVLSFSIAMVIIGATGVIATVAVAFLR